MAKLEITNDTSSVDSRIIKINDVEMQNSMSFAQLTLRPGKPSEFHFDLFLNGYKITKKQDVVIFIDNVETGDPDILRPLYEALRKKLGMVE